MYVIYTLNKIDYYILHMLIEWCEYYIDEQHNLLFPSSRNEVTDYHLLLYIVN